jgi:hypothetical protein
MKWKQGLRHVGRVLACCALAIIFFWCFIVFGFMGGRSAESIAVWTSVGLVLSPVFAYLTVYRTGIALDYALALVITFLLLIAEAFALSFGGAAGGLSSPFVFWPCLAADFAFGVWRTRGRPRLPPSRSHREALPGGC